jgi:tetratricopeptide (TPR) repeat protein
MKPRVFLGSSVEGLSVAYAIQTNLLHDAEITVWSQGVFELSATTIESLFEILNNVDFGVFVFTPDDLIKIRESTGAAVRDNVLFEFGLFLGKLGRQRVFFVVPSNHELHLPTDLLGITPAKYESNREDDNFFAATGPASHQIRLMLKKYGVLQQIEETSTTPEIVEQIKPEISDWFDEYLKKNYNEAIQKLDIEINEETNTLRVIFLKSSKATCQYRLDDKNIDAFEHLLTEYKEEPQAYIVVAEHLKWETFIDKSIKIIQEGIDKFGNSPEFIKILASCHILNGDRQLAINCFNNDLTYLNPDTAIGFANLYIDVNDYSTARFIMHKAYLNFPNNKLIIGKYASIASELSIHKVALFLRDKLSSENQDNHSYKGLLGNTCLSLELNDIALDCYHKANKLTDTPQSWILSNIGNLLKNRGFYTEGINYLRQSLEIDNSSEYALERLATSIKLKDEEFKEYQKAIKEGRKMIKEFSESISQNIITASFD